jgi:hypothetical protein
MVIFHYPFNIQIFDGNRVKLVCPSIAFKKILFMVRGAPSRASCWRSPAREGAPRTTAR